MFSDEGITAHIRNLVIKSDNANTNGTSIVTKMHLKRTKNWQARMTKIVYSFRHLIADISCATIFYDKIMLRQDDN